MRILVVMDPVEHINPEGDTTLVLVEEMHRRGHTVEICDAEDLELERGEAAAVVATVTAVDRTAYPCIKLEGGHWRRARATTTRSACARIRRSTRPTTSRR